MNAYFVCCVAYNCCACSRKGTHLYMIYCRVGHVYTCFLHGVYCMYTYGAKRYYLPCVLKVCTCMYLRTPAYVLWIANILCYRIVPFLEYAMIRGRNSNKTKLIFLAIYVLFVYGCRTLVYVT